MRSHRAVRRHVLGSIGSVFVAALISFAVQPAYAQKQPSHWQLESFAKYATIQGSTRVGSEVCETCHASIAKDFRHSFHSQQGVECEDCHGAGSLHVAGSGDVTKILSFTKRDATAANGDCLSCHAQDASVRNWMASPHASNGVRCTDCHQVHPGTASPKARAATSFDLVTRGQISAVEDLVPETKMMTEPRWQQNDSCLRCHQTVRAQMSMPYHHPLIEGKLSCQDCHDPHGGPAENNLRTATINELCLTCHAQYRGPFAYQHPPVTQNCMLCHSVHGSPNANLLQVSLPALCLQCHAGHHNGAGLPLADACTNCHASIHGSDVPTPSGGSRFVDKGPTEQQLRSGNIAPLAARVSPHSMASVSAKSSSAAAHASLFAAGAGNAVLATMLSHYLRAQSGGNALMPNAGQSTGAAEPQPGTAFAAYSVTPASYRFVDLTGFGGRVGQFDSLKQSAGAEVATSFVSLPNHVTVVAQGNVVSGDDYQARSQLTAGEWAQFGLDIRSFVEQQQHVPFYAFPVLDILPGTSTPLDSTTDTIAPNAAFAVVRRLGSAYGRVKLPRLPVHLFVVGNWQARAGTTQLGYLDENIGISPATCGAECHYSTQFQSANYTTRSVGGGIDVRLHKLIVSWEHDFSSFNDRLAYPTGTFGGFYPEVEGISVVNPPTCPVGAPPNCNPGPAPPDVPPGNYSIDIPAPNQYSSDRISVNWTPSSEITFNGNVSYTRLRDLLTQYPQNTFDTDETLNWRPVNRLLLTADYHQHNVINGFTPYYTLFGNVSYHQHSEGLRLDYKLPRGFDAEAYYHRSGITRSNAYLWPQVYSMDNTDLLRVVPSSFSNTAGLVLRYRQREHLSARAGYEWTGTHHPGYLIVPQSNNRVFADVTLTPVNWLIFDNDLSVIVQNDFLPAALPNTPGQPPDFGSDISGLPPNFQRRNRYYYETASVTLPVRPVWNVGFGYSYQQNNLNTYMAFQNDASVNFVLDQPNVPYKQITQAYWGQSSYTLDHRLGLNLRVTYNSSRSGFRPDLNPNDAGSLGNQALIDSGLFDPAMYGAALSNMQFAATQISEVIVPQWIGQAKAHYQLPYKFDAGLTFYYGSYRDYWNPNLNGVLRTFSIYVGRSW